MGLRKVLERREDLPEMRWPLVIFSVVVACVSMGLAITFEGMAMLLTVPFLVVSVVSYSALILLWRRWAALMVPLGMIGVTVLLGGSWLVSACILGISYVYASLFLGKASRFVRVASTASAVGIGVVLLLAVHISSRYGTLSSAIPAVGHAWQERVSAMLGERSEYLMIYVFPPQMLLSFFYDVVEVSPAILGMGSIAFAWACDRALRWGFHVLSCTEYFTPEADQGITLPKSFCTLYGVLLFLLVTTNSVTSPHIYKLLSNCHWVFAVPCFGVGIAAVFRVLYAKMKVHFEHFYLYSHKLSPIAPVLVLIFVFLLIGISLAFILTAILGVILVFRGAHVTEGK